MAPTLPTKAIGGNMKPTQKPPEFLDLDYDIRHFVYETVAEDSTSVVRFTPSRGMTPQTFRPPQALSFVNKQVRSEFNRVQQSVLARLPGPIPNPCKNIEIAGDTELWACNQYAMQIYGIADYAQVAGYLHDGHIITNKPFVLEVNITMDSDYNLVRQILLNLRDDWSHTPKLEGISIKFSIMTVSVSMYGLGCVPGLSQGHWNSRRRESDGQWIGTFWKATKNSARPRPPPVESVDAISTGVWPIDAHSLQLFETYSS